MAPASRRRPPASQPRLLIAPNAFKGTLTARQAAEAMARGFAQAWPEASFDLCPIADGGDGLLDVLAGNDRGDAGGRFEIREATVSGPLGDPVRARWGWRASDRLAVIEMAEAAGLRLLGSRAREPMRASTRGVGELLREAASAGAERALLGAGGSATVDGGSGALAALGWRFEDARGAALQVPAELERLARVVPPESPPALEIETLCDVDNPLLGPSGAAAVFGPQKGAAPGQVAALDARLAWLARLLGGDAEKREVGTDAGAPGMGAAGGLAFGLAAAMGSRLVPGAERVLELLGFRRRLAQARLLVTGEGKLDAQSVRGKAPAVAARLAREAGVAAVALCGRVEPGAGAGFALTAEAPSSGEADESGAAARAVERAAREWVPALRELLGWGGAG